jgi:glycosidase
VFTTLIFNLLATPGHWPNLATTTIYEVNIRAHAPNSNFKGIAKRIPELKRLGINMLWLMPIFPVGKVRSVGQLGSPYAVQDYDAVNPEFGTMADFDALVNQAHQNKMKVILDWVANHTSWDHAWLNNAGWHSVDSAGNVIIPPGTNWNDVADLNFKNQDMRRAMIASMTGWVMKHHVDGFRCDYADGVPADFWTAAITSIRAKANKPIFWLAEGSRADLTTSGFDLTYGWPSYGVLKDIFSGKQKPEAFWGTIKNELQMRFITNHDECAWDNSPVALFGSAESALSAFALLAFSGGVPLLYTGQEVGWAAKIPFFAQSTIDWKSGTATRTKLETLMQFRQQFMSKLTLKPAILASENLIAFTRKSGDRELLFVLNPSAKEATFEVPSQFRKRVHDVIAKALVNPGENFRVAPREFRLFSR